MSETRYSSGVVTSQNLENEIKISDTLGDWKFDVFFDILKIKIIYLKGNLPKRWTIKIEDADKTYECSLNNGMKSKFKLVFEEKPNIQTKKDDNLSIETFLEDLEKEYSQSTKNLSDLCKKLSINNVRNLIDAKNGGFLTERDLYGLKTAIQEELKKYTVIKVGKILEGNKLIISFYSDLHKIKRFFYSKCKRLNETTLLDEDTLLDTYYELQNEFKNKPLLEKIKNLYFPLTIPGFESKLPRGVLFYGPPGTGKTTVAELFPDLIGLTAINFPIASTEVMRSLVGETERLLR